MDLAQEDRARRTRQALLLGVGAYILLSLGDGLVKSIAGQWPGTAVAALRYAFGSLGLAGLLWWREGRAALHLPRPWIQLGRGLSVAVASVGFFLGIYVMPLAEATAIVFTAPIFATLFSWIFLGERPPRILWLTMGMAIAGVGLIVRPNLMALGWAALLPFVSALGMALLLIFNRMAAGAGSTLQMQFSISAVGAACLVVFALCGHASGLAFLHVSVPALSVIIRCAIVAVSASISHTLLYMATERVSAATVAPTTYVQLLAAMAIGALVYGDYPDILSLFGAALIIGGGLVLWRQSRR
jgi:drug/metabolite transporter (DMT)-like permease